MKTLRNLGAVTTLIMVLSITTMAGEITTWVVSPTPPPPPALATVTDANNIPSTGTQNAIDSETLLTEITMRLLQFLSVV